MKPLFLLFKLLSLMALLNAASVAAEPRSQASSGSSSVQTRLASQQKGVNFLSAEDADRINGRVCMYMKSFIRRGPIRKGFFKGCSKDERKAYCETNYPEDRFSPNKFIPLQVSETLGITDQDELTAILPQAIAQLMTMPCKKVKTEPYERNKGDAAIKIGISFRKTTQLLDNLIVPLCKQQADYHGCLKLILNAAEPLANGTDENLVEFVTKIKNFAIKFDGLNLSEDEAKDIYLSVTGLDEVSKKLDAGSGFSQ